MKLTANTLEQVLKEKDDCAYWKKKYNDCKRELELLKDTNAFYNGGRYMTELKVYHCNEWHNEYTEFYLKYDADKVIVEKDKEIAELKDKLQNVSELLKETREWLIESQKMHKRCADNAIKKIRHHKYKRCRANAKWCHDMWFLLRFDKEAKKSAFFWRWWNIWLEIADKFKEDK